MLKFENVSLSIGAKAVLKQLNFEVAPGGMIAILGASGAGKSSVFRLLIGEKKPTLGSIKLDEIALEKLSLENIQKYQPTVI